MRFALIVGARNDENAPARNHPMGRRSETAAGGGLSTILEMQRAATDASGKLQMLGALLNEGIPFQSLGIRGGGLLAALVRRLSYRAPANARSTIRL